MKKLKYQLTTKFFANIIKIKILVLQKLIPGQSLSESKTYTKVLAKQLDFANLIPLKKFKFPLSLFTFASYHDLQMYYNHLQKTGIVLSSIVLTKIKSNIILKSHDHIKLFNSKQTFLNFSYLFRSNILILKTLKMFK